MYIEVWQKDYIFHMNLSAGKNALRTLRLICLKSLSIPEASRIKENTMLKNHIERESKVSQYKNKHLKNQLFFYTAMKK